MAVTKLRNRGEEPTVGRPDYLFRQAVTEWSRQYAKVMGTDLGTWRSPGGSALGTPRPCSSARFLGLRR